MREVPQFHQYVHREEYLLLSYNLQKRLQQQDIHLEVTKEALAHLAEAGFDPVYGARPLKRTIQQLLENPLAQDLLSGKFKSGETIKLTYKNGEMKFTSL